MSNPIEKVKVVIDDLFLLIENDLKNIELESFSITLFQLIIKIIELVELTIKEENGRIKKYIVIEIGKKIVLKYYPEEEEFYNEYIDNLIEIVIASYYQLKKLKGNKNCFPCF